MDKLKLELENLKKENIFLSDKSIEYTIEVFKYLGNNKPNINIDKDTNFVNLIFETELGGLLTILIGDNCHFYFSLIEEENELYKLSGSLKLKTKEDIKKIKKILNLINKED